MWDDEPDLSQIRENVKRRLRYRRSPIRLVILAVIVSMIIGSVLTVTGQHLTSFPTWIPGFIGIMIFLRILGTRRGSRNRLSRSIPEDDEIERAVRRELRRQGYTANSEDLEYDDYLEKPKRGEQSISTKRKNDAQVRLGDDGELIFDEESPEESEMTSQDS